jgi:hypothetical protein
MKYSIIATTLAGIAIGMPQGGFKLGDSTRETIASLRDRNGNLDAGNRPATRNEINDRTPCGKVTFIYGRATTEIGNMVCFKFLFCDLPIPEIMVTTMTNEKIGRYSRSTSLQRS